MRVELFRYCAQNRPIGYATVPAGHVGVEPRPDQGDAHHLARHGVVVYDRPLTRDEYEGFELAPILAPREIDGVVAALRADVAEYREEMVAMRAEDPVEIDRMVLHHLAEMYPGGVSVGDRTGLVLRVLGLSPSPIGTVQGPSM